MSAFEYHLFVCGNQRNCDHPRGCCDPDGNNRLRDALKAAFKTKLDCTQAGDDKSASETIPSIRVNSAGCLDQCELGPTLVIYPQGVWYGNVQTSDVPRIVESLTRGEYLDDLRIPDEMLNTKGKGPASNESSSSL